MPTDADSIRDLAMACVDVTEASVTTAALLWRHCSPRLGRLRSVIAHQVTPAGAEKESVTAVKIFEKYFSSPSGVHKYYGMPWGPREPISLLEGPHSRVLKQQNMLFVTNV